MNIIFKLLGTAIGLAAGLLGNKLVNTVWRTSTGQNPPDPTHNLEYRLRSVLVFTLISSAVSAIIQVLTSRGTQKAIRHYSKTRDEV